MRCAPTKASDVPWYCCSQSMNSTPQPLRLAWRPLPPRSCRPVSLRVSLPRSVPCAAALRQACVLCRNQPSRSAQPTQSVTGLRVGIHLRHPETLRLGPTADLAHPRNEQCLRTRAATALMVRTGNSWRLLMCFRALQKSLPRPGVIKRLCGSARRNSMFQSNWQGNL